MTKRLHHIANWSTKSDADAKDLAADALVRFLDPNGLPWVPKRTFLMQMAYEL